MKTPLDSNTTGIERAVAKHYGDAGLLNRLLAGLDACGLDRDSLQPGDLASLEEFHIGGREATEHVVSQLALTADQQVLDVGCGIGGAARYIADTIGCRVTGIDLTPEFIATAKILTGYVGLSGKTRFHIGTALSMPYPDACFDVVITLHAAMNIADRDALYQEIARVLKPGGRLCVYDVMKKNQVDLVYPVPWASSPRTSYLTTPEEMSALLHAAGFEVIGVEDRTKLAIDFFRNNLSRADSSGQGRPVHPVMGRTAREKFSNTLENIEQGRIGPVQIMSVKSACAG